MTVPPMMGRLSGGFRYGVPNDAYAGGSALPLEQQRCSVPAAYCDLAVLKQYALEIGDLVM
eukprot:7461903-Lingulodinium_polyedra.AAC.1